MTTIRDLIGNEEGRSIDQLVKSRLIAHDARDGKVLFDTGRNKKEFIMQFFSGEVLNMWADFEKTGFGWQTVAVPVIRCYVSHNSWKKVTMDEQ